MSGQLGFFAEGAAAPEGLLYVPEAIGSAHEADLLARMPGLPFAPFEFHGYQGRRRVVSFGWRYDFARQAVEASTPLPPFLLELREVVARIANLPPGDLAQVLVTEYEAGAAIGWHRDKAVFGQVIGISLRSPCVFRLRRRSGSRWQRHRFVVEPRSAYVLRGPARTEWEHSIPPVRALRYSITFRETAGDRLTEDPPPTKPRTASPVET
jgi:alkylated DNA repair dioxygenase AlkB